MKKKEKPPITFLGFVMDASGSMEDKSKIVESRNSFNSMLEEQKKLSGKAYLEVMAFDHNLVELFQGDLNNFKPLTEETYKPGGSTRLFDAIGTTIYKMENFIKSLDKKKKPKKVILTIMTDGEENSSKEFKAEEIKAMFEEKRKEGWEIIFLGSSEEAIKNAEFNLGLINTISISDSGSSFFNAYNTLNTTYTSLRGSANSTVDINDVRTKIAEKETSNGI